VKFVLYLLTFLKQLGLSRMIGHAQRMVSHARKARSTRRFGMARIINDAPATDTRRRAFSWELAGNIISSLAGPTYVWEACTLVFQPVARNGHVVKELYYDRFRSGLQPSVMAQHGTNFWKLHGNIMRYDAAMPCSFAGS
jgi:hypothetical protein